ncbi:hypothetical protein M231_07536 [Tremella mesenterica]|uniref:Uncharacterized protein n=1 Tax=Tremella mesenterica TaxID=5217 RepID=A0A4Q1BFR2_TREME|nr:hypothetical protein M231_07536 [Tremella mesenterica]
MGLLQSRPSPTPPPSLPSIGPTQPQPRGPLSYFSIHSPPDTSHTHDLPTSTDTTLLSHYLTHKGLPEDVVDRILGLAEFWSPCRRHCGREICVIAGTLISRRGGAWSNGQEEDLTREMEERERADQMQLVEGVTELNEDGDVEEHIRGEGVAVHQREARGEVGDGTGNQGGGNREEEEDRVRDAWSLDRRGEVWFLSSEPIGCSHRTLSSLQPSQFQHTQSSPTSQLSSSPESPSTFSHPQPLQIRQTAQKVFEGRKEKIWVWKIVVDTLSKDQGWSSSGQHYGTYQQCYSWFEVSLWRDGREVEGSRCSIQSNVHAGQYFKSHRNVLGPSHSLVQQAKQGDRVLLWARAQYPGWRNYVREASITIYTAPFPPSV